MAFDPYATPSPASPYDVSRVDLPEDRVDYTQTEPLRQQSPLRRGIRAALHDVPGAFYTTRAVVRQNLLGDEEGALADLRSAQPWFEEAERVGPEIKPINEWEGVGDFTDAALGTLGRFAPDIALTLASAGVGGLAARTASGVLKNVGSKAAARVAQKATTSFGAGAGAGAAMYTLQGAQVGRPATERDQLMRAEQAREISREEESRVNPHLAGIARVIDADTVDVLDPNTGTVLDRVRQIGINAADRDQQGYEAANNFVRNAIDGKPIRVMGDERDRTSYERPDARFFDPSGRRLAHIYTDDSNESLGTRLLKAGQVAAATGFHRETPTVFRSLEAEGREAEGALPLYLSHRAAVPLGEDALAARADFLPEGTLEDLEPREFGEVSDDIALGQLLATGLDIITPVRILNRFLPGSGTRVASTVLDRIKREVPATAATEALTEGAQTIVERAVAREIDENRELFGEEGVNEILTAMTLGGVFGAAGGVVGAIPRPPVTPAPAPETTAPAPETPAAAAPASWGFVRDVRPEDRYEVSTRGDRRFSAFNARLQSGKTIEEAYQTDVKGYGSISEGKGKPPKTPMSKAEGYRRYKALWQQWAQENPQLIEELRTQSRGKTLTDQFARTNTNQARALAEILREGVPARKQPIPTAPTPPPGPTPIPTAPAEQPPAKPYTGTTVTPEGKLSRDAIKAWSADTDTALSIDFGKEKGGLFLPPIRRADELAQYRTPQGETKNISAYDFVQSIRTAVRAGAEPNVRDLARLAHIKEIAARPDQPGRSFVYAPNKDDVAQRIVTTHGQATHEVENPYERDHPLLDRFDGTAVTVKENVPKNKAATFAAGQREVREVMKERGLVLAGIVDDKMFFMTRENFDTFVDTVGAREALKKDANIYLRLGTLLKRPGGQEQDVAEFDRPLELDPDAEFYDAFTNDESDGTIFISTQTDGNGIVQGTWLADKGATFKGKPDAVGLGVAKGVGRRPLQINHGLDKRVYKEKVSINRDLQLDKEPDEQVGLSGPVHVTKQVGYEPMSARYGIQSLLSGIENSVEALRDQTKALRDQGAEYFRSSGYDELHERGITNAALVDYHTPMDLITRFNFGAERALALGATPDGGLKDGLLNPDGTVRQIGQVALLPGTARDLERSARKKFGKDFKLVPGTRIALHRDPALMDGSGTNVFEYVGTAKLLGPEPEHGFAKYGIVVSGRTKLPKKEEDAGYELTTQAMALDFDGDQLTAWVDDPSIQIRDVLRNPAMQKRIQDPMHAGRKPIPLDDIYDTDKVLDELYDGFNQSIGRPISAARHLMSVNELTAEDALKSSVAGQETIHAKKKPANRELATKYIEDLEAKNKEVRDRRGKRGLLEERLGWIGKKPAYQHQQEIKKLIKEWQDAIAKDPKLEISEFERALLDHVVVVDQIMTENNMYARFDPASRDSVQPPVMKHHARKAHGPRKLAGDDAMRALRSRYNKLNMELHSRAFEDKDDERRAMASERNAIAARIDILYNLGEIDPAAMLYQPSPYQRRQGEKAPAEHTALTLVGRPMKPEDMKEIYPAGIEDVVLSIYDVDGKPLEPGTYSAIRPVDEGYVLRKRDKAGKMKDVTVEFTTGEGNKGWGRELFDSGYGFKISELPKEYEDYSSRRTEAGMRKVGRGAKQRQVRKRASQRYRVQRIMRRTDPKVPDAARKHYEAKAWLDDPKGSAAPATQAEIARINTPERQEVLANLQSLSDETARSVKLKNPVRVLLAGRDDAEIRKTFTTGRDAMSILNGEVAGMHFFKNGAHNIALAQATQGNPNAFLFHTYAHEIGHAIAYEYFGGMPSKRKPKELNDAWLRWRAVWQKKYDEAATPDAKQKVLRSAYESIGRKPDTLQVELNAFYALSYDEWFAENVSRWFQTSKKPHSVIERFFKAIADSIRKVWANLGKYRQPDPKVEEFMNSIWVDSASVSLPKDATQTLHASSGRMAGRGTLPPTTRDAVNERLGVEALLTKAGSQERKLGSDIGTVGDNARHRADLAVQLGHLMSGSDADRQVAFVGAYNYLLNDDERGVISKALFSGYNLHRIARLTGDARVLNDDTYAAAKGFTLWLKGEISLGPNTNTIFGRLYRMLTEVMGIVTKGERADRVLRFLRDDMQDVNELSAKLDNPHLTKMGSAQLRNTHLQRFVAVTRPLAKLGADWARSYAQRGYMGVGYKDNPAARELVSHFYNPALETGRDATTFEGKLEAMSQFSARWNTIREALETDEDSNAFIDAWYKNRASGNREIDAAVASTRKLMDDIRNYAVVRGVKLGKIENYNPWVFDLEFFKDNQEKFKSLLYRYAPEDFWRQETYFDPRTRKRALRFKVPKDTPVTPEMKRRKAQAIYDAIFQSGGDTSVDFNDQYALHTPYMGAQETRILRFLPDKEVAPFLTRNPDQAVMLYMQQAVSRAEFVKRFGLHGEKLNALYERMRKFGMKDKDITRAQRLVDGNMGTLGLDRPQWHGNVGDAMIAFQNWRILGLTSLTQFTDAAGVLFKSESFRDTVRGLRETIRSYKGNGGDLRKLRDMVGAAANDTVADAMAWQYGMQGMRGIWKEANDALFTWNGTRMMTTFMRTWALSVGRRRIAEWVKEGNKRELAHLGLRDGDVTLTADDQIQLLPQDTISNLYARAARARENNSVDKTAEAAIEKDERVRNALTRIVDESNIRPTASVKPVEANDRHIAKMLVYHLTPFMYGFWDIFTNRALINRFREGGMREKVAWQFAALWMFPAIYMFSEFIRDLIQHQMEDDPMKRGWDEWDWWEYSMWSSGVAGPMEFLDRATEKEEQGKMPIEAVLGPTAQWMFDNFRDPDGMIERSLPLQNIWKHWLVDEDLW